MTTSRIFTVIPAFNEEKHIKNVVQGVAKYCKNIVVVDDGSTDSTNQICQKLPIALITLPINQGKGYALRVGVEYALSCRATGVITFDSDGQHNPSHIPKFISSLKNYDVVLGIREGHHPVPLIRKFGNKIASLMIYFLYQIYTKDLLCGFRAFTSKAYPKIKWNSRKYGVETEMVAKVGMAKLKYTQIRIENIYLDQFKGVTLLDAIEVFLTIPKFKIN